jgi:hypothetical protein
MILLISPFVARMKSKRMACVHVFLTIKAQILVKPRISQTLLVKARKSNYSRLILGFYHSLLVKHHIP